MFCIFNIFCFLVSLRGICVVMVLVKWGVFLILFSDVSIFGGIFLFSFM